MDTLDMEDRIVKLEQFKANMDTWVEWMENRVTAVEEKVDSSGDSTDTAIEKSRPETLAVEKKYETLLEAMREITKLAEKIHSGSELAASMNTVAMYALDAVRDKPSDAPSEAKIDEKDSEIWRLQTELLKENNEHLLCQRRYEIARRQLDIATEALREIAYDEKLAGNNLENSPARQALRKLKGGE